MSAEEWTREARQFIDGLGEGWTHTVEFSHRQFCVQRPAADVVKVQTQPAFSVLVRVRHETGIAGFAVFVDGHYDFGASWVVCQDPLCAQYPAGIEHPASPPRFGVSFADLCVITSDLPVLTEQQEVIE